MAATYVTPDPTMNPWCIQRHTRTANSVKDEHGAEFSRRDCSWLEQSHSFTVGAQMVAHTLLVIMFPTQLYFLCEYLLIADCVCVLYTE